MSRTARQLDEAGRTLISVGVAVTLVVFGVIAIAVCLFILYFFVFTG